VTVKEPLEFEIELLDYLDPTKETIAQSVQKISEMDARDREIVELAKAKNNLESFIYEMKDKLEHDQKYKTMSTSDDREKITSKLTEINDWLWDDGATADVKTLKSKLDELKTMTRGLTVRVKELDARPLKLKELKETLNLTEHFLKSARTMIGEDQPFTDVEVKALEKAIKDTTMWRDQMLSEQERTLPTETPKYLSSDIEDKIVSLKREVSYLLGKAQRFVPKPKTTPKPPTSSATSEMPTTADAGNDTSTATSPTPEEQPKVEVEEEEEDNQSKRPTTEEEESSREDEHPDL